LSQPPTETSRKLLTSARVQACAISEVNRAAPNKAGSDTTVGTAHGTGQVCTGASGELTGANCSRSEVLCGHEDGGRGPDRVAMFDNAGGLTVM
jgi:hypothetical protein